LSFVEKQYVVPNGLYNSTWYIYRYKKNRERFVEDILVPRERKVHQRPWGRVHNIPRDDTFWYDERRKDGDDIEYEGHTLHIHDEYTDNNEDIVDDVSIRDMLDTCIYNGYIFSNEIHMFPVNEFLCRDEFRGKNRRNDYMDKL